MTQTLDIREYILTQDTPQLTEGALEIVKKAGKKAGEASGKLLKGYEKGMGKLGKRIARTKYGKKAVSSFKKKTKDIPSSIFQAGKKHNKVGKEVDSAARGAADALSTNASKYYSHGQKSTPARDAADKIIKSVTHKGETANKLASASAGKSSKVADKIIDKIPTQKKLTKDSSKLRKKVYKAKYKAGQAAGTAAGASVATTVPTGFEVLGPKVIRSAKDLVTKSKVASMSKEAKATEKRLKGTKDAVIKRFKNRPETKKNISNLKKTLKKASPSEKFGALKNLRQGGVPAKAIRKG
jgi:hypothetical protein